MQVFHYNYNIIEYLTSKQAFFPKIQRIHEKYYGTIPSKNECNDV